MGIEVLPPDVNESQTLSPRRRKGAFASSTATVILLIPALSPSDGEKGGIS